MKRTLAIVVLALAPTWLLASNIDSDEVVKTALGVLAVTVAQGIQALAKPTD